MTSHCFSTPIISITLSIGSAGGFLSQKLKPWTHQSQAESIRGLSWDCPNQSSLPFGSGSLWMGDYSYFPIIWIIKPRPKELKWVPSFHPEHTKSWCPLLFLEAIWVSLPNKCRPSFFNFQLNNQESSRFCDGWSLYYLGIPLEKELMIMNAQPGKNVIILNKREKYKL